MIRFPVFFPAVLIAAISGVCFGELILTAEVAPLSGLDGFSSYRITATSDLGNVVAFDFSKVGSYGISGPMNQLSPFGQSTVFSNQVFGDYDASLDTQFLFNSNDVVSLFSEETPDSLHSVFAVCGDQQLTIGNSVPFVQIATSSAQEVLLKGSLVVRRPNDEMIEQVVNIRLSDIQVSAAPHLDLLPVPPPVLPPVTVVPPAPITTPPVMPVVEPPETIILPAPEEVAPVEPPLVTEPPQYTLPEVTPDAERITDWPVYEPVNIVTFPWIEAVRINLIATDTTFVATSFDFHKSPKTDLDGTMLFNGAVTADDGFFSSAILTQTTSTSNAPGNAFSRAASLASTGFLMDADRSLGEVPEPASAFALLLSAVIAACSRRGGLGIQRG